MSWFTYIYLCADNSFYVGHTSDLTGRVVRHNSARGARHTAVHGSGQLIYSEEHTNESAAISREQQIKRWSRAKKAALVRGDSDRLRELSQSREG